MGKAVLTFQLLRDEIRVVKAICREKGLIAEYSQAVSNIFTPTVNMHFAKTDR
jgi:hypothetical protein